MAKQSKSRARRNAKAKVTGYSSKFGFRSGLEQCLGNSIAKAAMATPELLVFLKDKASTPLVGDTHNEVFKLVGRQLDLLDLLTSKKFGPVIGTIHDAKLAKREGSKEGVQVAAQSTKKYRKTKKPVKEIITVNGRRFREI